MKLIILFLNFLICFSNILENIRKEIVDKALLYLPKRETENILKMVTEMSKAREQYSMSEGEVAYFVYKWVAQNIEIDCREDENIIEPYITYREGKGKELGILSLYDTMCGLLSIESHIVNGLIKYRTSNKTKLIDNKEYTWSSVLIDNNYYLLDLMMGFGYCYKNEFTRTLSRVDSYFGILPEESIRYRFPNDNKWQLLSKPITFEEFKHQGILESGFFKFFKTISPDVQTFTEKTFKIKLTFDKPIGPLNSDDVVVFNDNLDGIHTPALFFIYDLKVSDGACEFSFQPTTGYIDFALMINSTYYPIATYEVYN